MGRGLRHAQGHQPAWKAKHYEYDEAPALSLWVCVLWSLQEGLWRGSVLWSFQSQGTFL